MLKEKNLFMQASFKKRSSLPADTLSRNNISSARYRGCRISISFFERSVPAIIILAFAMALPQSVQAGSCNKARILAARQKLTAAIISHNEMDAMMAASDGFNAENGCFDQNAPATLDRARHVASFVQFTLYGYVYGGHRRDFLSLGKSFGESELRWGKQDPKTRKELISMLQSIEEKQVH
jgi:hypothetical protein